MQHVVSFKDLYILKRNVLLQTTIGSDVKAEVDISTGIVSTSTNMMQVDIQKLLSASHHDPFKVLGME